ncbi:hypothetical protein [Nocardioides aurantiacus]|uniref:Cell division protein CrgA n=1 Tax=Nocardioides aurantiacus TaxID=86796 RepID=A0A3N2CVW6_9ACTN|nr:hypothetical protein [Nocardioides aurantiacus]ROR91616.1 hypothetical protein EDD33_2486 [Nocardioides aurantiacus]
MAEKMSGADAQAERTRKAGAFDIRNFIGMLIGIFGVVLLIASIFDSAADIAKADGVRVNLWAGAGMVLTALVFFAWARLRPVVVPEDTP